MLLISSVIQGQKGLSTKDLVMSGACLSNSVFRFLLYELTRDLMSDDSELAMIDVISDEKDSLTIFLTFLKLTSLGS